MRYRFKLIPGLALAAALVGCKDFLSGSDITDTPNASTELSRPGPLYVSIQALQSMQFEGQLARDATMYAQQIAGVNRQQRGYDRLYNTSSIDMDPYFLSVYAANRTLNGGGGLLDIRKMQSLAQAVHDSLYIGIAKVYEALVIGTAASIWGDLPYSQAVNPSILTPTFDPQLTVYNDVIAQLDSAINIYLFAAAGGVNAGPPADGAELLYAGRNAAALRTVYTAVAHSLKARYLMHLAETDNSKYALALAEVPLGISSTTDDMLWFHDASSTGQNVWWQFNNTRTGDIGPGAAIIEILKRRINAGIEDSSRLKFYFTPATTAGGTPLGYFGYRPGASIVTTAGGIYDGSGATGGAFSGFTFIDPNVDANGDFRTPIITYAETQLIGAEAAFHAGGQAAAQPFLDAARANRRYGSLGGAPVVFPSLASVPATLQNIMEEKYVSLFLNIEVWNDYKRTCLPSLATAPDQGSSVPRTTPIPGRLPYGLTEVNANPNTPVVSSTGQNANDPNACPALDYTSSVPLAN